MQEIRQNRMTPLLPSSPHLPPRYQLGVLFLVDRNDLHALVETAVLAHAVSQLHLMALGALNDAGHGELPVRTTAVLASLRDFPFGRAMVTPPRYWQPNC